MENLHLINKLAYKFGELVRSELSQELEEIRTKNKSEEYAGCCATHDYCDANMLMDQAFTETTGRQFFPYLELDNIQQDEYCASQQHLDDMNLFNRAWTQAIQNEFRY